MNLLGRCALIAGLTFSVAGAGWWIAGAGEDAAPAPAPTVRFESSQQCKSCHQDVWDEWHGSHHQIAYLNPEVRALSDDFRNKECQACHLPRPVALTGYGQRVLPRQTHPDEGVSCLTCHLGTGGEILGRSSVPSAPCAPQASKDLVSVDLCASCHNQHQTTDQWRASPSAAKGEDCNDCHMPAVTRRDPKGGAREGRAHRYPGAHDAEMLRAAATFDAALAGDALVVTLVNRGAGHNFPTEERHRAVDVEVSFTDASGTASPWQRLFRFRQPYRDEPGENTQLAAGATWTTKVPIPTGTRTARARLWYRLTPFAADDDPKSTLLFERDVSVP